MQWLVGDGPFAVGGCATPVPVGWLGRSVAQVRATGPVIRLITQAEQGSSGSV